MRTTSRCRRSSKCCGPSSSASRSATCSACPQSSAPESRRTTSGSRPASCSWARVSAIIASKGAIEADDDDATFAIAAILALGAFGLFAYPAIVHLLHMNDRAFGVWAGLAVDNTVEAAAAGAIYSDLAGKIAVVTKSTRNAMIGFVVLAYAIYWASRGQAQAVKNKAAFVWQKFPKFVCGFLLVSLLATLGAFSGPQIGSIANLSRWAFLLCFAGVGLKTDFREIRKQGVRPFVVGALAELTITVVTLGLVLAAQAWFAL